MSRSEGLDISYFSNELQYLMRLLRSDYKLEAEEAEMLAQGIDWQLFLRYTVYHEIYSVLYPLLMQLNAERQWTPDYVMASLKALCTSNTFLLFQLRGEMERMNRLLEGKGIRHLFLRGPILTAMLYSEVSGPTSYVLDILVARQDWDVSVQQLQSSGYIPAMYDEADEELNSTWQGIHHASYFHPDIQIKVDLHSRLNPNTVIEPSFEQLWARRQSSVFHKHVCTLGNEDLLVYLILYGTRNGWLSLRWLLDIDRMMGQFLNWNRINQLLEESGARHLGGGAFVLATQLLGTLLPEEAHAMTLESKARRLAQMVIPFIHKKMTMYLKPKEKDIAVLSNRYLLATMSYRQKLLYINNKLYESLKSVLPLLRSLHYLYIPLLLVLWFWRHLKRQTPKKETSS
ncbi:nucleotidyltransferase family protein [Paenibacillus glycanilyticus]|uniref:nucleotidyltransferase domain-containing protein n=1 Tax=Paenibacillus glycanilyticus TaxID=126569 RepID=UPI002040B34A|nr:nucleotidyltransferase family protein [Paenibacillus glycanilyticus]MCM3628770.1 nucleotidyltransferase family protein [Paenibacillus glycanilyticus]